MAVQARRAVSPDPAVYLRRLRRLVVLQVGLDWLCMAVFLHLTGGITSPGIVFLLIHMLMVAILLPGVSSYLYVALGVGGLLVLALLEAGASCPTSPCWRHCRPTCTAMRSSSQPRSSSLPRPPSPP